MTGDVITAKAVPCPAQGCLRDSVREGTASPADGPSFANFQATKGAEKALRCSRAIASGEATFVWLLLYGVPGNGKTHLSWAIAREVKARHLQVRMILAADLFSCLREAMGENQTDQMLRRLKEIFFLIIDDYGVEYGSEWEQAKFDELMSARFANARPTVITTNKDFADLPERLQSRFTDKAMCEVAHNDAPDFRRLKTRR